MRQRRFTARFPCSSATEPSNLILVHAVMLALRARIGRGVVGSAASRRRSVT